MVNDKLKELWKDRTVLTSGGGGMLGSYLSELFLECGASVLVADNFSTGKREWVPAGAEVLEVDLRNLDQTCKVIRDWTPDAVFHLAARVSGIAYNEREQSKMLRDNILIQAAMGTALEPFPNIRWVNFSSACVLPNNAPIPTGEEASLGDGPEDSNRGYGWAKIMAEMIPLEMMKEDPRRKYMVVRPWNMYSERDHYEDPDAHVIPALAVKMLRHPAGISVRGTGRVFRSFLHAKDAAMAVLLAEASGHTGLLHIGAAEEISIRDLVGALKELTGFTGSIQWDSTKAEGYPRRLCDPTLLHSLIDRGPMPGWRLEIPLGDGLKRVVNAAREFVKTMTAPSA